jgi:hypothetical protein
MLDPDAAGYIIILYKDYKFHMGEVLSTFLITIG